MSVDHVVGFLARRGIHRDVAERMIAEIRAMSDEDEAEAFLLWYGPPGSDRCAYCGEPLPERPLDRPGRRPIYCNRTCQVAAYRERSPRARRHAPTCAGCATVADIGFETHPRHRGEPCPVEGCEHDLTNWRHSDIALVTRDAKNAGPGT